MTVYRDLIVWRRALDLAHATYGLARRLPTEEAWGLRGQLTRAVVSVAANIAEGWTRESVRERANFLSIAQGSLAETDTLLVICEEAGLLTRSQTEEARAHMEEVGKMLSTLRKRLREKIGAGRKS
ncbi:MAG: four helix bundle protein [Caulobacteraceae bacterium]